MSKKYKLKDKLMPRRPSFLGLETRSSWHKLKDKLMPRRPSF